MASNIQTLTPGIVGLIPVPLAGTLGIVLGWLFSLFFLWLAAVIGISRKEFAAALEATAGMVPVVGPALSRGVKAVETVGTKFYNRADKISASISKAFGSLQGAIAKVKSTASSLPSLDKFAGPNPPALPSLAQIQSKAAAALPPLPAPIPAAGEAAPSPTGKPTTSALPTAVSARKVFPPTKGKKKGGRGRFTRRKRSINRKTWRTTRRR
jgi:hypothetical protein